jgi:hypothetical protein
MTGGASMIDFILKDSDRRPDLFFWNGELSLQHVEAWGRERSLCIPEDLKKLWSIKGGGDLFESETVLQPFGAPHYDLIEPLTEYRWSQGLSKEYFVFHTGLGTSVFRKLDGVLFYFGGTVGSEVRRFQDLDTWYLQVVRAEFAKRYRLEISQW